MAASADSICFRTATYLWWHLGGHIGKRSIGRADVFLESNQPGDNIIAMDPPSMANFGQPGVTFRAPTPTRGKKDFAMADIRKNFAADAFIVLYLCHSAQDPAVLQQIGNFRGENDRVQRDRRVLSASADDYNAIHAQWREGRDRIWRHSGCGFPNIDRRPEGGDREPMT
jgi:hypothetical protein